MNVPLLRKLVFAGIALTLVASAPISTTGAEQNEAVVYISDFMGDRILILNADPRKPTVRGEIDGLKAPQGLAVDASGDLYVANSGDDDVLVFRHGSRHPSSIVDVRKYGAPGDVAVGTDGTMYVSILYQAYHGHKPAQPANRAGCVLVFSKGALAPSKVIRNGRMQYVVGVAVDRTGQIFVSANDNYFYSAIVNRFPPVGEPPTIVTAANFAGGLVIDPHGRLIVVDQGDMTVYGQPYGSIVAIAGGGLRPHRFEGHLRDPLFLALNATATQAWVVDPADGDITIFAYPSGQLIQNISGFSAALAGIAISPAAPLGRFIL